MAMSVAPELMRCAAAYHDKFGYEKYDHNNGDVHIEPPAEMEQNSKTPSNAGLSSPTRTMSNSVVESALHISIRELLKLTPRPMVCQFLCCFRRNTIEEVDVFVGVEGAHNFGRGPFWPLGHNFLSSKAHGNEQALIVP